MYKKVLYVILGISLVFVVYAVLSYVNIRKSQKINNAIENAISADMKITSTSFENEQTIPAKYTCDSDNVNPQISIEDVPDGTKSLVLVVDDPDAPGGFFNHWLLWNISADTTEIKENSVPQKAVQGVNSYGKNEYKGPCPPKSSQHRYDFKVYALSNTLSIVDSSHRSDLLDSIKDIIIGKGQISGYYSH